MLIRLVLTSSFCIKFFFQIVGLKVIILMTIKQEAIQVSIQWCVAEELDSVLCILSELRQVCSGLQYVLRGIYSPTCSRVSHPQKLGSPFCLGLFSAIAKLYEYMMLSASTRITGKVLISK